MRIKKKYNILHLCACTRANNTVKYNSQRGEGVNLVPPLDHRLEYSYLYALRL